MIKSNEVTQRYNEKSGIQLPPAKLQSTEVIILVRLPFRKYKLLFAFLIFTYMASSILYIAQALLFKDIFDAISEGSFDVFSMLSVKVACFIALLMLNTYLQGIAYAGFCKRCSVDLKNAVIDKITTMDFNSFTANNSAKYVSIINNDVKVLTNNYYGIIPHIIYSFFTSISAAVTLFYFSPLLAVVSIVLGIFPLLIPILLKNRLKKRQNKYMEALERYNVYIRDIFSGFEALVSFGAGHFVRKAHAEENSATEECNLRLKKLKAKSAACSRGIYMLVLLFNQLLAVALVIAQKMTLGSMMAAIQIMNFVVMPIQWGINGYSTLTAARAVVSRVEDLLAEEEHRDLLKVKTILPLRCENLSFSYEEGQPVAVDLNCILEPGKKYAVVGSSGSGKSTFLKLLMKYYDTYQGNIYCGDHELRRLDKTSLFQNLAAIHQNVVLFNDTIRTNICMYAEYSDKLVIDAARRAGLWDLISSLPEGLNTMVEENGHNFSGGEKQRISIARAILRQVPLLLMDEATSSLDPVTAQAIENDILTQEGMAAVSITHHLIGKSLPLYDQILVMQEGCFVEQGTFDDLMKKQGVFWGMHQAATKHDTIAMVKGTL